ncbi:Fibronectin, type III [Syntrophomonas zehnderi OL-4]|uniref:Fibronectin, type III n=1 Tax=Syntrophomonas zehnderi OL-4 TaxID=690567 RepID=A0A0E4GAG5_9FIRM|nr:hypothetical protein [Syntrophomonas zehnderi]CFX06724.1 Fibronectin, type III [Syntrophomonas zehnderi OL-4]CFX32932.1 Fibronectin, type III [Syntrophomonas zehnderi OL-4]
MADINGVTLQAGTAPTVIYTITYTKSRPNNNQMTYNFTISAALGSSGSFIHNGYALLCTMTVNGYSSQVRIKAVDGDNWDGTTPRLRYVSVTCPSTTGNTEQGVRFRVVSDGRLTLTSGVIDTSSYTVLSSPLLTTACGAPTSCSVSPVLAEGGVTLSWSGASGGISNTISSYEIQYSESTDNFTWGAWMPLATVSTTATSGSVATSPPSTRGNYRRFQVRTRGTAGASYYSGWKVSTNSVRRNTAPKAPTTAVSSPAAYSDETITLTWSGASGGTSPVKGYQIARRTSTDNSTWTAWNVLTTLELAASGGSYNPNVSRVPGTYTQFGIWTIDTFDVYSVEKISNSIYCDITACGAPTVCTVSATLSEGNVTLSWSGASGGAGNAITSYEIQYCDSTDNSNWGDWIALTTVSTSATSSILSVSPPSTRGNYRRFRIKTRGAAGENFYSDWTVSSNTVRRNTLPTPPTSFTATPAIYESATVTLSWSGTIPGTSAIKQYVIQRSTSTDGINWSAYEALTIVVSSATSGTYTTSASQIAGTYTRYRISVTDTLDAVSGYVVSGTVKKNSPPTAPVIVCPVSGSSGYNTTPRFMITTGIEPDGQTQIVEVKIDTGAWVNSVDNPEMFSVSGYLGNGVNTVYQATTLSAGSHTVTVRCLDSDIGSSSPEVVRSFTVILPPFETITANDTHVKATHIQTLRIAVNTIRSYYNLSPVAWSEDIIAGKTAVKNWPFHIMELRKAIESVITTINSFDSSTTFDIPPITWLPIGTGRPRADVMQQIQNLILML